MQNVEFQTVTVLPIGTPTPTTLVKAPKIPMRVEVSNVGPVVIFVAAAVNDLTPQPSTATYRVFPGEIHVFVTAPKQGLYAVAAALGGLASVSASEALPTVL